MTRQMNVALLAIGVGLGLAAPAWAQNTEIARSGLWSAFRGSDATHASFCGIATDGGAGRRMAFLQYPGIDGLDLKLSKESWNIPTDTPISMQFRFDGQAIIPARATGEGHDVTVHLSFEQSVPFMRKLREGQTYRIGFPNGNETQWSGGLSGSSSAIDAFNDCRASLAPISPAAPSQPFQAQPQAEPPPPPSAPTQPFTPAT